jgi:hypothetical protein
MTSKGEIFDFDEGKESLQIITDDFDYCPTC